MIKNIWKLAAILATILTFALVNGVNNTPAPPAPTPTPTVAQAQPDETSGRNIFRETAPVDMSQIDYVTEDKYAGKILIPTDANSETTPTVEQDGYWIPEESPDGTSPTGQWLDNSPTYEGGWFLQVNDATHRTEWREMTDVQYDLTTVTPNGK